jgi:hypothetical protein
MALNPQEQARFNQLVQDGIRYAQQLGDTITESALNQLPNAAAATNAQLRQVQLTVSGLAQQFAAFAGDVSAARQSFAAIVDEIKGISSGVTQATSAFRKLESVSRQVQQNQAGIGDLSKRQLESLKDRVKIATLDLKLAEQSLKAQQARLQVGTAEYQKVSTALANVQGELASLGNIDAVTKGIDKEIDKVEKFNRALGATGAATKGLGGFLKNLGFEKAEELLEIREAEARVQAEMVKDLQTVDQVTGEITTREATYAEKLKYSNMLIKEMGKNLLSNAKDPQAAQQAVFAGIAKATKEVDKATGKFAKDMNMTYKESLAVGREMFYIASRSGDVALTQAKLLETQRAVGVILGTNAKLNEQDLVIVTKLNQKAGIANETSVEYLKLAKLTYTTVEGITGQFFAQAKVASLNKGIIINEKQLYSEIAKTSAIIKLNVGLTGAGLATAAANAKALGISLEKTEQIAGSITQFESSIQAELEAELLTGKQINLERARYYALTNDTIGLQEELAEQIGTLAEYQGMNRIAQESFAKALGLSREEMAASLLEAEALKGLTGDQAAAAKIALDARIADVGLGKVQRELQKGSIEDLMHQQDISERLAQTMDRLKEIFVGIGTAVLAIADSVSSIVEGISIIITPVTALMGLFEGIGKFVGKMLDDMKGVGKVLKALINLTIIYAAIKSFSALAGIPYVGPVLGAAAAATVLSTGYGIVNSQKMEDGLSTAKGGSGYGKRMLYDEGELFALNNRDNVLVTTNPILANDMFSPATYAAGSLPGVGNLVAMEMIQKISKRLDQMQPQGAVIQTSVNIDGQVAGRSLEIAKYKTSA